MCNSTPYNNVAAEEPAVITLPSVKIDQEAFTETLSQIKEGNTVFVHKIIPLFSREVDIL